MHRFSAAALGVAALAAGAGGGCGGAAGRATDARDGGAGDAAADTEMTADAAVATEAGPEKLCGVASELYDVSYQAKLDALVGCTRMLGLLRIGDSLFTNLDQLSSLRAVDGSVNLFRNESLTQIDGLRNLETVGAELRIGFHPKLTRLNLASLRSVGELFYVFSNYGLATLAGLENLRSVGTLQIGGNLMLPEAEAEAFAATVTVAGSTSISNNGP